MVANIEGLAQKLSRLDRRTVSMISRATVLAVSDKTKAQALKVNVCEGEEYTDVEWFRDYGFTSVPGPGSEALFLSSNGVRSGGVCIGVQDRRVRKKDLERWDVAQYHKDGQYLICRTGGGISIVPAQAGKVHIGGDIQEHPVAHIGSDVTPNDAMIAFMQGVVTTLSQIAALLNAPANPVMSLPGQVTPPPPVPVPTMGIVTSGNEDVLV